MKQFFRALLFIALLALTFGLGWAFPILKRPVIVTSQNAVVFGTTTTSNISLNSGSNQYIDISPTNLAAETLFIFYPGGLVRPQAYEWLGTALAEENVRTIIPVFPFDLAVLNSNRANQFEDLMAQYDKVILGGHSLGGAMAARYALKNAEKLDGLVLMGAFSAGSDDLSGSSLPVQVQAAEHDGLATLQEIQDAMQRLPANSSELVVIQGAVHSFFGRYGPQRNDGLATISRHEAEQQIISALKDFLMAIP